MKLINMIPQQIKDERVMDGFKKSAIYLISIPVLFSLGLQYQSHNISSETRNLNSILSETTTIINQIKDTTGQIEIINRQKDVFKGKEIPLNHLLYFLSVNVPEDIRIISIKANTLLDEKEEDNSTQKPETTTNESSPTDGTNTPESTTSNPLENLENNVDASQGENVESPTTESPAGEGNKTSSTITDNTVTVIGYGLYPDSVAKLSDKLRENNYIKEVKVIKIDNYFTGKINFKIFELKITKQG